MMENTMTILNSKPQDTENHTSEHNTETSNTMTNTSSNNTESKPEFYGDVAIDAKGLQTPMMKQFIEIKNTVPDALLFYRMGDFYELFLQDAVIASDILDITLTSRNKNDEFPIPMAGVPYHAMEGYITKLSDTGIKLAIAEQVESDDGKMMNRVLTRVITPGIPFDNGDLDNKELCWLASVSHEKKYGLCLIDIFTGEFKATEFDNIADLQREIDRVKPREILCTELLKHHLPENYLYTVQDEKYFEVSLGLTLLAQLLNVQDLRPFQLTSSIISSAASLIHYIQDVALIDSQHIKTITKYSTLGYMTIDPSTMRNLEVLRPMYTESKKATLLHLLDKTRTPMGGRMLKDWLSRPLMNLSFIVKRQEGVQALTDNFLRMNVQTALKTISDLEKLSSKLAQNNISPRDLHKLASSVVSLPDVLDPLDGIAPFTNTLPSNIPLDEANAVLLALVDEPPVQMKDGGVFRKGYNNDLDEIVEMATNSKQAIANMEAQLRIDTEISSLKIKNNKVFGYFIEVTQANKDKVPQTWYRKQTLVNAERYINEELKEFESKLNNAAIRRKEIEDDLYEDIKNMFSDVVIDLQTISKYIAYIDVLSAFAECAVNYNYVRPKLTSEYGLDIKGARHPVIENIQTDEPFVPNDIAFDDLHTCMILTGPNMAGKSTIMRQTALLVLMAQIGCFIPATSATIGICDKLFVRVGASDDVAHGRSTFMVEMSETAYILENATQKSLIMLDEIGRGTSTFDGLSIAWAVAECIHDKIKAKSIFATHYHELTALKDKKAHIFNKHVQISESKSDIIFLRTLGDGGAQKSYGVQCAKLAGIPRTIINRAKEILKDLEVKKLTNQVDQLSFFSPQEKVISEVPEHLEKIEQILLTKNIETMSPLMAMQELSKLIEIAKANKIET